MPPQRRLRAAAFETQNPGSGGSVKFIRLCLSVSALVLPLACATPQSPSASQPPPTPTKSPMSRTNPNIVEEDELHFVERFPKDEYIRVDANHFRHMLIPKPMEFYKEDDKYYYVYTYKPNPELAAIERALKSPTPRRFSHSSPGRPAHPGSDSDHDPSDSRRLRGHLAGARAGADTARGGLCDRPAVERPVASFLRHGGHERGRDSRHRRPARRGWVSRDSTSGSATGKGTFRPGRSISSRTESPTRPSRSTTGRSPSATSTGTAAWTWWPRRTATASCRCSAMGKGRFAWCAKGSRPATSRRRPSSSSTRMETASSTSSPRRTPEARPTPTRSVSTCIAAPKGGSTSRRVSSGSTPTRSLPGISTATAERTFCREATSSGLIRCSGGIWATAGSTRCVFRSSRSTPTTLPRCRAPSEKPTFPSSPTTTT